jgi:hypothetical protein
MIPITAWKVKEKQKDGSYSFTFNHIEDGHSSGEKPMPKFDSQRGWLNQTWTKQHCWLNGQRVIVY